MYIGSFDEKSPFVYTSGFWLDETLSSVLVYSLLRTILDITLKIYLQYKESIQFKPIRFTLMFTLIHLNNLNDEICFFLNLIIKEQKYKVMKQMTKED